jgi:hypothetical protein
MDIAECARFRNPEKLILNRKMIVLSYMKDWGTALLENLRFYSYCAMPTS